MIGGHLQRGPRWTGRLLIGDPLGMLPPVPPTPSARNLPLSNESATELRVLAELDPKRLTRPHELSLDGLVPMFTRLRDVAVALVARLPEDNDLPRQGFAGGALEGAIHHLSGELDRLARLPSQSSAAGASTPAMSEVVGAVCAQTVRFLEAAAPWLHADLAALSRTVETLDLRVKTIAESALRVATEAATAQRDRLKAEETAYVALVAEKKKEATDTHHEWAREANQLAAAQRNDLAAAKKEADDLLAAVRAAAGVATTAAEAIQFRTLADHHRCWAWVWFVVSMVVAAALAVGLLLLAGSSWPLGPPPAGAGRSGFDIARFFSVRALCVLAAYYLLNLVVRNYRAHQHNEVINRHREKALTTFEQFVKSTKDERVKDAVLLQASTTVFSAHATGFLGGDETVTQGTIIDAVKLATGAPPTVGQPPTTPP